MVDFTNLTDLVTKLLMVVGGLVVLVNILTEVIKQVTQDKIPASLLALILSQVVTLCAFFAYSQIIGLAIMWFHIVAAIILGFIVAYAAMFGYDKLKEILEKLQ